MISWVRGFPDLFLDLMIAKDTIITNLGCFGLEPGVTGIILYNIQSPPGLSLPER